jgi:hypothetical protein
VAHGLRDLHVVLVVEPVVVRLRFAFQRRIVLPALLREQVLRREPHLDREPRHRAHEHDVIGVVHHRLRHERRRRDVLERRDRAGALRRTVHHARVELHDAVRIRQAAQPDRLILRIELLDVRRAAIAASSGSAPATSRS